MKVTQRLARPGEKIMGGRGVLIPFGNIRKPSSPVTPGKEAPLPKK
jgi:hypothetical protein